MRRSDEKKKATDNEISATYLKTVKLEREILSCTLFTNVPFSINSVSPYSAVFYHSVFDAPTMILFTASNLI